MTRQQIIDDRHEFERVRNLKLARNKKTEAEMNAAELLGHFLRQNKAKQTKT